MENAAVKDCAVKTGNVFISTVRTALVGLMGVISLLYLSNPTGGLMEIIPDNLPVLGNIDEAAMTAILIYSVKFIREAVIKK